MGNGSSWAALGWNWVGGEPWGWLPYHFGSWVNAPGMGWAWLPVGATSWMPATASWVHVNNQLGWIPNGPPPTSKLTKTQLAAVPSTAILAAQGASGAIRAGARMPLGQAGLSLEAGAAPSPSFIAPTKQSTQPTAFASGSANPKSYVQSAPTSLARGAGAPASLAAPNASTAQLRVARLQFHAPCRDGATLYARAVMARGASTGGFRGGFGGAHGGGSAGTMSASRQLA